MAQALCEVSRGCIGFVTDPANSSCSFRAEVSFTECGSVSQWRPAVAVAPHSCPVGFQFQSAQAAVL
jgi:hypothetical protein